jgi:uncharacterized membrane protein (UPF0127 family)
MAVLCRLSYSSVRNLRLMIEARHRIGPALLVLIAVFFTGCTREETGPVLIIESAAGEVRLNVEIADSIEERQVGLMNRKELAPDAGMVFVNNTPTESNFWMKNTLIPLSLAVWGEGGKIAAILDMEPCRAEPCVIYRPGVPWVGAVEVNQGFFEEHGVKVGDQVRLVD